ncbi:glycosyltransferase family 2 protein, partial [Brachyspira sp. G79]|uniref:glycosyltransferase family 2 protein n=1 Tax=Brachyspira sp. G79 TaxID=1358104 RepID=UPI001177956D
MNKIPFFSIIIPVYNTEKYLKKCLDSVINQTFKDIEIIIVNDHSPKNCDEIVSQYKDERIVYIKHEVNKGLLLARKTGNIKAS